MENLPAAAAGNNARWCDAVCRSLGMPTRWRPGVWAAGGPPPPFYPDRITLTRGLSPSIVLDGVPDGAACAVKDSFADLDLTGAGFSRLFEGSWISRRPRSGDGPATLPWSPVRTVDQLGAWSAAAGGPGTFGPPLLDDPDLQFLAVEDGGEILAGAAVNTSDVVVGLSNVFATRIAADDVWAGLVAFLDQRFPERTQVGYERGLDLNAAVASGFTVEAPLRVWFRGASD